jgi:hypothetical protein
LDELLDSIEDVLPPAPVLVPVPAVAEKPTAKDWAEGLPISFSLYRRLQLDWAPEMAARAHRRDSGSFGKVQLEKLRQTHPKLASWIDEQSKDGIYPHFVVRLIALLVFEAYRRALGDDLLRDYRLMRHSEACEALMAKSPSDEELRAREWRRFRKAEIVLATNIEAQIGEHRYSSEAMAIACCMRHMVEGALEDVRISPV